MKELGTLTFPVKAGAGALAGEVRLDPATKQISVYDGTNVQAIGSSFDGPWTLALDSGLATSVNGTMVLGRLGDDLYLFGSNYQEAVGTLVGVWRYRNKVWTHLSLGNDPHFDFNRFPEYGAVAYNNELYVGDRRAGALRKLLLNSDGSYNSMPTVALVGAEDIFPGPVMWGQLYCGTYGNPNIVSGGLNPEVWTWDGTEARRVLETGCGTNGEITSLVPHGGLIWVAASGPTVQEMWTLDQYGVATKVFTDTVPWVLGTWNGDLVGCKKSQDGSGVVPRMAVWRDGWMDISSDFAASGRGNGLLPLGEDLLMVHYYNGLYRIRPGQIDSYGLGSYDGTNPGAPMSLMVHDDSLFVTTSQPPRVYQRRLGVDRFYRRNAKMQQSLGGSILAAQGTMQVPFRPDQIPGLRLWLNGDSFIGTADGTAVSSWADTSGHGLNATQATGASQPTVQTVGGKKVVRFAGSQELDTAALDLTKTKAVTVYIVIGTSVSAVQIIAEFATTDYNPIFDGFLIYTDLVSGHSVLGQSLQGDVGYSNTVNTRALISGLQMCVTSFDKNRNSSGTNEATGFVNDDTGFTSGASSDNTNFFGNRLLHIGARAPSKTIPFTGDIRHLLIFDGNHNSRARTYLETWFSNDSNFSLA